MVALNYCKMEQYIMSLSNLKRQQLFLKIQPITIVCYEIYFIFNMSSSLKCRLDFTSKFDTDTLLLLHAFCTACAFQIGINLAILHSKSIYSKSNLVTKTKPSLIFETMPLSIYISHDLLWYVCCLWIQITLFCFNFPNCIFANPFFSSKLEFSLLWLAWQIDIWITIKPFCNLLAHTVGILYNEIYL